MKKYLLFILLVSAVSARSQSLKDLLYSGKLKMDTGGVIHKGDDLSSKIDTSTRKPVEAEKPKAIAMTRDTSMSTAMQADSTTAVVSNGAADNGATATRDNNKVWKDYMDELIGTLRTEVLPNKKIKNGTYSVLIEYTIDVDGQISVNNVSASPESSFLEEQIRNRMTLTAPQLTPLLGNNGKPRKALKKQTITIAK